MQLGDEAGQLFAAIRSNAPVSIRINPFKSSIRFADAVLVPWCAEGRYLDSRPSFTLDPLFHAGCYYVQEASSMFLEQAIRKFCAANKVTAVLDLCAAPGGKSTHLRSLIPEDALLVANEPVLQRNHILSQNLAKWGHAGVLVTRNEPGDFLNAGMLFDIVVVDAPCSGEGMFRKDETAIGEWSVSNVLQCAARQRSILEAAVAVLAPGGLLVYSTCTWSPEEDEQIIEFLTAEQALTAFPLPAFPGVISASTGARFYPHRLQGEGFFIAGCIKSHDAVSTFESTSNSGRRSPTADGALDKFIQGYVDMDGMISLRTGDTGWMLPKQHLDAWSKLSSRLRVVASGCKAAVLKGNDWVPAAELAFSRQISSGIPTLDLEEEAALRYLRGEAIPVPKECSGWLMISFQGFGLGWGKAVNGRLNNAYPKEWRIRMELGKN